MRLRRSDVRPAATIAQKVEHVREAPAQRERSHTCHAHGCEARVKPATFMCARHWRFVPASLRRAIWHAYAIGQEDGDAPVSREYLDATTAAIRAVHLYERVGASDWRWLVRQDLRASREHLEAHLYELREGLWVALRPARGARAPVFGEVVRDATTRAPHVLDDVPASLMRVRLGGDPFVVDERVLPNALVLRYCSDRTAMNTSTIPREWFDAAPGTPLAAVAWPGRAVARP